MKRAWSILLSVLLGAAVVGIGTGYFLHLANKDRQSLAQEAKEANDKAIQIQQDHQNAIQEANRKLDQANGEVNKAQNALKALEQERSLLNKAQPLLPLPAQSMQDWQLALSASLGIALRFPPGSTILQDSENRLSVTASGTQAITSQAMDGPWINITSFDRKAKDILSARLATSTPITYFVNGHLLDGLKGSLLDGADTSSEAAVLDVYQNGSTTHLIWIQSPPNQRPGRKAKIITLEDVLATLDFPKQP